MIGLLIFLDILKVFFCSLNKTKRKLFLRALKRCNAPGLLTRTSDLLTDENGVSMVFD